MKTIETKHGLIQVLPFENAIKEASIICYNKTFIEIPGIVIFSIKNEANLLNRILNPSVEIIMVEKEHFEEMKEAIQVLEADNNSISFESKTKPAKKVVVNLESLKKAAIFVRTVGDSITINNTIFTNNEAEYHGDGMFTSKTSFFIDFEKMALIRNLFKSEE